MKTREKINPKVGSFKKINKMDKFLVKLKKKRGFYLFKCP